MTTIARHVAPDTIRATARHIARRRRRVAVLRFTRVWQERIDRHAIGLTIAGGTIGGTVFLAVGYAARLYQEGVL